MKNHRHSFSYDFGVMGESSYTFTKGNEKFKKIGYVDIKTCKCGASKADVSVREVRS